MTEKPLQYVKSILPDKVFKAHDVGDLIIKNAIRQPISSSDVIEPLIAKILSPKQKDLVNDAWASAKYLNSKYEDILLQEFASGIKVEIADVKDPKMYNPITKKFVDYKKKLECLN